MKFLFLLCILFAEAWCIMPQIPLSPIQPIAENHNPNKVPLCLISSWEEGPLPKYTESTFRSLVQSEGYAKLFLFYYKSTNLPPPDKYSNIEFIDMSKAFDGIYKEEGFTQFLADRLCDIYGVTKKGNKHKMLKAAIQYLKYRPKSAPAMVQLRGMYGRIFEHWVNSNSCDAWAWTDLDVLFGDFKGWLENNKLVWDMDVFTLAGEDWNSVYTRGQFTAHVLKRYPKLVNNIWRLCTALQTTEALANTLVYSGLCIDEGCYGRAVVLSKLAFGIFLWQGNDWDWRGYKYATQIDGSIYSASNCDNDKHCEDRVLSEKDAISLLRDIKSGKKVFMDGIESLSTSTTTEYEINRKEFPLGNDGCLWWIAPNFKTCVVTGDYHRDRSYHTAFFTINNRFEMVTWKAKNDSVDISKQKHVKSKVDESLMFHFSHWKGRIEFPDYQDNGKKLETHIQLSKFASVDSKH